MARPSRRLAAVAAGRGRDRDDRRRSDRVVAGRAAAVAVAALATSPSRRAGRPLDGAARGRRSGVVVAAVARATWRRPGAAAGAAERLAGPRAGAGARPPPRAAARRRRRALRRGRGRGSAVRAGVAAAGAVGDARPRRPPRPWPRGAGSPGPCRGVSRRPACEARRGARAPARRPRRWRARPRRRPWQRRGRSAPPGGRPRRRPDRPSRSRSASASTAVAAARSCTRARWTSWRTAPSLTPSSRATSSCAAPLDRHPQQRLALALRQRRQARQRLAGRPRGARARPRGAGPPSAPPQLGVVVAATPQLVERRVVGDPVQPRPQLAHLVAALRAPSRPPPAPAGARPRRALGQHAPAGAQQRLAVALDDRLERALVPARARARPAARRSGCAGAGRRDGSRGSPSPGRHAHHPAGYAASHRSVRRAMRAISYPARRMPRPGSWTSTSAATAGP